ncbi:MAG TPA: hypothetical protein VIR33_16275 [Thermopolyspora sp.]
MRFRHTAVIALLAVAVTAPAASASPGDSGAAWPGGTVKPAVNP